MRGLGGSSARQPGEALVIVVVVGGGGCRDRNPTLQPAAVNPVDVAHADLSTECGLSMLALTLCVLGLFLSSESRGKHSTCKSKQLVS